MCLIVAKPKGTPIPSNKKLKQWFVAHPDGFGLAFVQGNRVRILKGAMTKKEMLYLTNKARQYLGETNPTDVDMIFHFRLASDGSVTPQNCHPFPITNKESALSALDIITDTALVHNGIIWDYSDHTAYYAAYYPEIKTGSKTDTQQFITEHLVGMGNTLFHPQVLELIRVYTESKFALLTAKGITYIGEFINDQGCWYSNGGYKPTKPKTYTYYKTKPVLPYEDETSLVGIGGTTCDWCQLPSPIVYQIPDDDCSLVCADCFETVVGRKPTEEERFY